MSHPVDLGSYTTFSGCHATETENNADELNTQIPSDQHQVDAETENNADELNAQIPSDQHQAHMSISVLTIIKVILCVFLVYECHFNFIEHLPLGSLLFTGILATVVRVLCSLIIFAMLLLLPEKNVCSLEGILYKQEIIEKASAKPTKCSDLFF